MRTRAPDRRPSSAATHRLVDRCALAVVAIVAATLRLRLAGGGRGLRALHGYDDGVYYAAADAFVHGRLPYRDFTLVHPPGVMLALAPFAALGRVVGDADGLAAARLGVVALGAANAVLVARLARRWGRHAGLAAGALYAVSATAAYAERTTLLEPFGTVTLLAGALLLVRAAERTGSRGTSGRWRRGPLAAALGGAVVGLGVVVKIWAVVPLAIVVAWQWRERGPRVAAWVAAGAGTAIALVVAPFAVAAPARMARLVVVDQLGRPRYTEGLAWRLERVLGVDLTRAPGPRGLLVAAVTATLVGAGVAAWRRDRGRVWVVLLAAQVGVLLASPSYQEHYAAFAAPAVALVLAAGLSTVQAPLPLAAALAAGMGLVAVVGAFAPLAPVRPFPAAQVRAQLPATGCVQSDQPAALALLGVLSRDLADGCHVPVDVTGETYDVGDRTRTGATVSRIDNRRWQSDAVAYLGSGSATVLARADLEDGLQPRTLRRIRAGHRVVVHADGVTLLVPDPLRPRTAPA